MVSSGEIYFVLITLLLLFGLVVSLPVFVRIIRDGIGRNRSPRSGDVGRETDEKT